MDKRLKELEAQDVEEKLVDATPPSRRDKPEKRALDEAENEAAALANLNKLLNTHVKQ
jgi:hypothetical protein